MIKERKIMEQEITNEYHDALRIYLGEVKYNKFIHNSELGVEDIGKWIPMSLTYIESINVKAYLDKMKRALSLIGSDYRGRTVWNVSKYYIESCEG